MNGLRLLALLIEAYCSSAYASPGWMVACRWRVEGEVTTLVGHGTDQTGPGDAITPGQMVATFAPGVGLEPTTYGLTVRRSAN